EDLDLATRKLHGRRFPAAVGGSRIGGVERGGGAPGVAAIGAHRGTDAIVVDAVGRTVVPEDHHRAVLELEDLAVGGDAVGVLADELMGAPGRGVIGAAADGGLA